MSDDERKSGKLYTKVSPPKEKNPISDVRFQTTKGYAKGEEAGPSYENLDLGIGDVGFLPANQASRAVVQTSRIGTAVEKTGREIIGYHTEYRKGPGPDPTAYPVEVPDYKDIYSDVPVYKDRTVFRGGETRLQKFVAAPGRDIRTVGRAVATGLGVNQFQTQNALRKIEEQKAEKERLDTTIENAQAAAGRKQYVEQAQNQYRKEIRGAQRMQRLEQTKYQGGLQQLVGNEQGGSSGITQMQPLGLSRAAIAQRQRRLKESISLGHPLSRKEREYQQITTGQSAPVQQSAPQYQGGQQYAPQQQYQPQYQPQPEPNGFFNVPAQNQSQGGGNPFFEEARAAQIAAMAPPQYQPNQGNGMTVPMQDPFAPSFTQPQPQRFGQQPIDAGSPFQQNVIQVRGGIPAYRVQDAGAPFGMQRQGPPVDVGSPFGSPQRRVIAQGQFVQRKGRRPPYQPPVYQPDPVFGI